MNDGLFPDASLLGHIKNGSEHHFKELFTAYWSRLYSLACNALDSSEDAQDVVQEIFIDIWKRREKLEVENIGAYLFKCVSYGIARKLKHTINNRTEELFEAIMEESDLSSEIVLRDLVQYVEGKIEMLPDRCKEIFKLSRFDQLSNKEIADKLNVSIRTVENQIHRATKILKSDSRLSDELTFSVIILLLSVS